MGDVVFHSRLRDAVEVVVDDDISLIKFHGAKLQKNPQPKPAPELRMINSPSLACLSCAQSSNRGWQHGNRSYEMILSPTMDAMSVVMKNSRQNVAGSWKKRMPTSTVPTAPMPVQTG